MATKVILKKNQTLEDALRVFRRKMQRDQILKEAKKRKHFSTRSAKLKAKKKVKF